MFDVHAAGRDQQFAVVQPRIVEIDLQFAGLAPAPAQFAEPLPGVVDQPRMFVPETAVRPLAAVLESLAKDAREPVLVPFARPHTFLLPLADFLYLSACQPQGGLSGSDLPFQRSLLGFALRAVEAEIATVGFQSLRGKFTGGADQVEQRNIVADHQDGCTAAAHPIVEFLPSRSIEVVSRFVEQDNRRAVDGDPGKQQAGFLAAAQRIDRGIQPHVRQPPPVKRRTAAGFDLPVVGEDVVAGRIGTARTDGTQRPDLSVHPEGPGDGNPRDAGLLGHVIGPRRTYDAARRGRKLAGDKFQERRLARTVVADERHLRARSDRQVEPFEQKLLIAIAVGNTAKDNTHMD